MDIIGLIFEGLILNKLNMLNGIILVLYIIQSIFILLGILCAIFEDIITK